MKVVWNKIKKDFNLDKILEGVFFYLFIMFFVASFMWFFTEPSLLERYNFLDRFFFSTFCLAVYSILRLIRKNSNKSKDSNNV